MGLISKYGKDLVGKIFIFQSCREWCIGKIMEVHGDTTQPYGSRLIYKPLGRSKNLNASPNDFSATSTMDDESKLIEDSPQFRVYLELFDGID